LKVRLKNLNETEVPAKKKKIKLKGKRGGANCPKGESYKTFRKQLREAGGKRHITFWGEENAIHVCSLVQPSGNPKTHLKGDRNTTGSRWRVDPSY